MTTPSQPNNEEPRPNESAGDEKPALDSDEIGKQTVEGQLDETPRFGKSLSIDELSDDLSDSERVQAAAAIAFLKEVREESQRGSQIPSRIGRYSIVRSLGRGGFAEVFLAEDEELDRRVALKIPLFNAVANESARVRFEREAKLAASLGHPQIIPVYEFGDLGPVTFIAFGWCDGPNLTDWISENGPLDYKTAAQIVLHLADAVQHAHQRGVVHRDLKPGNILVDESKELENQPVWNRLRIADFGLARNFDNHEATLTQDGQLVGTPAYMAPEQAGSGAVVGPAADVWALGIILFELLTGELPFRRDEVLATIRAICDEPAPKARKRDNAVPAGLDAIADLCLRKEPNDRYASAHELAEDLRRWLNDEPIQAKSPSMLTSSWLWCKRNPIVASSIALTFVSMAIGLSVSLWQRNAAIANLREAQSQTVRADGNLETAQALIKNIVELEKKLRTQSQLSKERLQLVRQASQLQIELIEDEEQTPQVRYDTAMSLRELSILLFGLRDQEASYKNAEYVVSLLKGLDDDPPEGISREDIYAARVQQRIKMGSTLMMQGKRDEAFKLYEANELEQPPDNMDSFRIAAIQAENLRAQSIGSQMQGDHLASADFIRKAIARFDGAVPTNKQESFDLHLSFTRLHLSLGMDEMALGDLEASKTSFLESKSNLESVRELFPNHEQITPNEGILTFQLGALYERKEDWPAAIEEYESCRQIQLAEFDQNPAYINPANIYVLASLALARCHKLSGNLEETRTIAAETVERSSSFPDQLKSNPAFLDNMKSLEDLAK